MPQRALILIDLQYDFMPGGALAVPHADEVIAFANQAIQDFELVLATQDWHPEDHLSFASQHENHEAGEAIDLDGLDQILWPDHCVQGTQGAQIVEALHADKVAAIFRKGMDRRVDSYSGFFDNGHRRTTGMSGYLKDQGVEEVHLLGVATDYCVKFTALDAAREGFHVKLLLNGCRGVGLRPSDIKEAIEEMREAGVEPIT